MSTPEERKAAAEKVVNIAHKNCGEFAVGVEPFVVMEWEVQLQADLTTAIELLRELDALLEKQGYMLKGKSRGKIAAFLSATNGGRG